MSYTVLYRLVIVLTLVVWLWVLAHYGGFGMFGGDGKLDRYNDAISQIRNIIFFKHLPDVVIEDDRPFNNKLCVDPKYIMGPDEDSAGVDCAKICHDPNGNQLLVKTGQTVIVDAKELKPGTYCMLGSHAACNPYTTTALYAAGGWSCFPKFSELGGIGGNQIMVCGGRLRDRLNNVTFENYIPSTFPLEINEKLDDGTYRYVCVDNAHPLTGYTMTGVTKDLRFVRITNPCTMGIENALDIEWDRETGECGCVPPLEPMLGGRCTNCPLERSKNSGLTCMVCHDPYLWRTNVETYPCIYGPHLIAKILKKDQDPSEFDNVKFDQEYGGSRVSIRVDEPSLDAIDQIARKLISPIPYSDLIDWKPDYTGWIEKI